MSIAEIIKENHGFVQTPEQMKSIQKENRLQMMLVRCGGGRFVCPAQDVEHFVAIINKEGSDYVRDISIKGK